LAGFLIFGLVFVSRDFEVDTNVSWEELTASPRTGLILLVAYSWLNMCQCHVDTVNSTF